MRNALLAGLSLVLSLEVAGWLSTRYAPELYQNSKSLIRQAEKYATPANLKDARSRIPPYKRGSEFRTAEVHNCLGGTVTHKLGNRGERMFTGYKPEDVQVLLLGDSYTFGLELDSDDTIAANLYGFGIMAANLGIPGYDPLMALQYARHFRAQYPAAKVAVLNVMYENINRLATSYWPVYQEQPLRLLSFKPFMRNGKMIELNPDILQSGRSVRAAATKAFREDYWARPQPEFPYSLALLQAVTSHSFIDTSLMRIGARSNQEYRYQYEDPELSQNLLVVVQKFTQWALKENLRPVVFFIPRSAQDTTSPTSWIERNREALPPELTIRNMDFSGVQPERFNLKPNGDCHPSPYGAQQVAARLQHIVAPLLQKDGN